MGRSRVNACRSQGDFSRACTPNPNEGPHGVAGAVTGAKRRRRSSNRRVEPCSQRVEAAITGPPCRRARLTTPPPSSLVKLSVDAPVANTTLTVASKASDVCEKKEEEKTQTEVEAFLGGFRAVLINMERRPDRLDGCAKRLAVNCPGLPWERMAAVDGRQTVIGANLVTSSWDSTENVVYQRIRSIRKGWDDLHTYHERVLELSPGERGCAASHITAWRHCVATASEGPLVVLEDDAAPVADFAGILKRALAALPDDAHVLYLGYSQAAHWRKEISPELVESEYVWTTVGYIVWPAGARLLLDNLPVDQPVDNYMALLCAQEKLKAYCVRPKIILQSDAWNCGSDIRHSDENYWGPDSDIVHSEAAAVPVSDASARPIPGAIIDDGSSFWDFAQKEQMS